jgi:hypothetical protein
VPARHAALAAVGAQSAVLSGHRRHWEDVGITLEDVQGVIFAVAAVIGTVPTLAAAGIIPAHLATAAARAHHRSVPARARPRQDRVDLGG